MPSPFQMPTLHGWMIRLLIGLVGLYVVELVVRNAGIDPYVLAWMPIGSGFGLWQPITHYLVQGAHDGAVTGVLFGLLTLYFALPAVEATLDREVWLRGLAAGAAGGIALGLLASLTGFGGPAMGWFPLAIALFILFGLALPDGNVKLFFVIDVRAGTLVWVCLAALLFRAVVNPGIASAEGIGVWAGVYGWWHRFGPGARRRNLTTKKKSIERELRRFEVIEGGRSSNRPDDDWVH